MKLGSFSVSLAVKDIQASMQFYKTIGFEAFAGDPSQNWVMLRNGETVIGLFQGMFEGNLLTFNPGWDQHCNTLELFDDVRALFSAYSAAGIEVSGDLDPQGSGPAHFTVTDPDGNVLLFDQHVP